MHEELLAGQSPRQHGFRVAGDNQAVSWSRRQRPHRLRDAGGRDPRHSGRKWRGQDHLDEDRLRDHAARRGRDLRWRPEGQDPLAARCHRTGDRHGAPESQAGERAHGDGEHHSGTPQRWPRAEPQAGRAGNRRTLPSLRVQCRSQGHGLAAFGGRETGGRDPESALPRRQNTHFGRADVGAGAAGDEEAVDVGGSHGRRRTRHHPLHHPQAPHRADHQPPSHRPAAAAGSSPAWTRRARPSKVWPTRW